MSIKISYYPKEFGGGLVLGRELLLDAGGASRGNYVCVDGGGGTLVAGLTARVVGKVRERCNDDT